MRNRFDSISNFGQDLMDLVAAYRCLQNEAIRCKLTAALYKAYFYNKDTIAKKLEIQLDENRNNLIGAFDGFCYDSRRADAIYRTLEDMLDDGIIDDEEYEFCNI